MLSEGKTANQIATELQIQTSAARKHLERLSDLGLVTETFARSGVGRPRKIYTLTAEGKEIFPRQYDHVLNLLLDKIVGIEGSAKAESVMRELAVEVAETINGKTESKSAEHTRLAEDEVNRLGFEASFNKRDGNLAVISRNCPLWKVALAQREVVCRGFHGELLAACFEGKKVNREKWMVDGDAYCKHIVTGIRTP